ncbi:DoxX family membrane protein [Parenemella sanctibonifatiensis]|uniref:DoxX family protein n=1 Tax=Parenemella sanctibonifatiensis TaxID=2016505 RepID=A0A255ET60_9ACTN|nr:DoxX family membrane protein [Parenemella sanctibonifatiensis]OYN92612.1 hypothetical protein CGZ91_03825 [Parenemella sanctibonifatiensis]
MTSNSKDDSAVPQESAAGEGTDVNQESTESLFRNARDNRADSASGNPEQTGTPSVAEKIMGQQPATDGGTAADPAPGQQPDQQAGVPQDSAAETGPDTGAVNPASDSPTSDGPTNDGPTNDSPTSGAGSTSSAPGQQLGGALPGDTTSTVGQDIRTQDSSRTPGAAAAYGEGADDDAEPTQVVSNQPVDDPEATQQIPRSQESTRGQDRDHSAAAGAGVGAGAAGAGLGAAASSRRDDPAPTQQMPPVQEKPAPEQPRTTDRQARDRALGTRERLPEESTQQVQQTQTAAPVVQKPTTHKFFPSLGLFLFRVVLGGIMGIHGIQHFQDLPGTQEFFGQTVLPEPSILAIVVAVCEVLIALSLITGFLTRLSGLGVTLITGGALALVYWGAFSPFQPGVPGFSGELELMLAISGFLLLTIGAGGWSMDAALTRGRRRRKAAARA